VVARFCNRQDCSLRAVESHVIPAKAGIQFVVVLWTPNCAGVTRAVTFISLAGPQAHDRSVESQ
jgi:hypothetical protein